jgi:4-hydroxybenzoate polyprenyltransferase
MTADRPSRLHTALRLGRASNVPTVWTNVAAGMALASPWLPNRLLTVLAVAVSLSYVGGMYLNDAFDAGWDARNRPDRPIPAGHVSRGAVFAAGFGMLAAGALLVALAAGTGPAFLAALALAALILIYDAFHKANPLGPLVMAACRVAVYVLAALAVHPPPLPRALYLGAGALALYLVFLSTLARKETLHPKLPKMIGSLVAGISLLDAGILLVTGHPLAAGFAVAAFFLTRYFQRTIPGS